MEGKGVEEKNGGGQGGRQDGCGSTGLSCRGEAVFPSIWRLGGPLYVFSHILEPE